VLADLITRATLEDLAGAAAYQRGAGYFSSGAVSRLHTSDATTSARVEGTEAYQVELRDDDDNLAYDCICPRAADGYFCKHCVAVGLAWLAENSAVAKPGKRRDPWREIKAYLATQPAEALIELLLDVAQRDDRLYQSLLLNAERSGAGGNMAQAFRRAIDDATHIHGFVDWREVGTFAGNIDQVADSLAASVGWISDSASTLSGSAEVDALSLIHPTPLRSKVELARKIKEMPDFVRYSPHMRFCGARDGGT